MASLSNSHWWHSLHGWSARTIFRHQILVSRFRVNRKHMPCKNKYILRFTRNINYVYFGKSTKRSIIIKSILMETTPEKKKTMFLSCTKVGCSQYLDRFIWTLSCKRHWHIRVKYDCWLFARSVEWIHRRF